MEVDPLVMRALHHLVSRKPESTEKLRQMLFESLGREYVPPKLKTVSFELFQHLAKFIPCHSVQLNVH